MKYSRLGLGDFAAQYAESIQDQRIYDMHSDNDTILAVAGASGRSFLTVAESGS